MTREIEEIRGFQVKDVGFGFRFIAILTHGKEHNYFPRVIWKTSYTNLIERQPTTSRQFSNINQIFTSFAQNNTDPFH